MGTRIAVYPGSFDPITNGHLDILKRALKIFDRVIIAVTSSRSKNFLFPIDERLDMLESAIAPIKGASAESFSGLLVNYARKKNACAIIRGLRAISDFEYEFQMAQMNRRLWQEYNSSASSPIETVYLMPDEKFTYLSSTLVKEIARLGGRVKSFVPANVHHELVRKFSVEKPHHG